MSSYPVSDGLGFEENPQDVFNLLQSIRTAAAALGVKLHKDFNVPEIRTKAEAGEMIAAVLPDSRTDHLFSAALAVFKGEDPSPHMLRHAVQSFAPGVAQRMLEARAVFGAEAINKHADGIVEELRESIFEPTIEALAQLLEDHPGGTWHMEVAIAEQDFTRAELIKTNKSMTANLSRACQLRAALYGPDAFTSEAAWITHPVEGGIGHARPNDFAWWAYMVSEGHELHFPTADEWRDTDRNNGFAEIREEAARAADEAVVHVESVQLQSFDQNR